MTYLTHTWHYTYTAAGTTSYHLAQHSTGQRDGTFSLSLVVTSSRILKNSLLRKVCTVQMGVTLIWLCRPFLLFPYTVQPFIFQTREDSQPLLRVSFLCPGLFSAVDRAWNTELMAPSLTVGVWLGEPCKLQWPCFLLHKMTIMISASERWCESKLYICANLL